MTCVTLYTIQYICINILNQQTCLRNLETNKTKSSKAFKCNNKTTTPHHTPSIVSMHGICGWFYSRVSPYQCFESANMLGWKKVMMSLNNGWLCFRSWAHECGMKPSTWNQIGVLPIFSLYMWTYNIFILCHMQANMQATSKHYYATVIMLLIIS